MQTCYVIDNMKYAVGNLLMKGQIADNMGLLWKPREHCHSDQTVLFLIGLDNLIHYKAAKHIYVCIQLVVE